LGYRFWIELPLAVGVPRSALPLSIYRMPSTVYHFPLSTQPLAPGRQHPLIDFHQHFVIALCGVLGFVLGAGRVFGAIYGFSNNRKIETPNTRSGDSSRHHATRR
jgi:hypothetical protein